MRNLLLEKLPQCGIRRIEFDAGLEIVHCLLELLETQPRRPPQEE